MTLEAILEGEAAAVTALHRGEVAAWQPLLEHLVRSGEEVAPRALVEAMVQRERSLDGWLAIARAAAGQCQSEVFFTTLSALRPFRPWLLAGLAAVLPEGDPALLDARLELLTATAPEDALEQVRRLVASGRAAWAGGPKLGQALLLLHRRATEAGQHQEALDAAVEAARLLAGDETRVSIARRAEGASLLSLQQFEKAFAVLDAVLERPGPTFGGEGAFVSGGRELTRLEAAIDEATQVVTWATATTPEWVRVLGGMAEASGLATLWRRFERALRRMLRESTDPDADLEVVVRQAGERELREVVTRAEAIGRQLGVA